MLPREQHAVFNNLVGTPTVAANAYSASQDTSSWSVYQGPMDTEIGCSSTAAYAQRHTHRSCRAGMCLGYWVGGRNSGQQWIVTCAVRLAEGEEERGTRPWLLGSNLSLPLQYAD